MDTIDVNLDFIMDKVASRNVYDGKKDDLLSGGLGKFGLKKDAFGNKDKAFNPIGLWEKAPHFDNHTPPPDKLRQRAIYNNYRALVDMSTSHPTAYYGELYGPGVESGGGEGLIAGEEYIALAENRVTMMVQIPTTFDVNNPCIITAPSSGSRGIYGAIGTAGEWGLKRGFAVAYTDKGTGMGVHNLMRDTVNRVTGERVSPAESRNRSNFIAISENDEERMDALIKFNGDYPDRIAFKHAHSQLNPEKDWGTYVLQSIKFAIYILNYKFSRGQDRFTYKNTLVIASSVSNGGGASLRAAEQDEEGIIDGIAVAEPNVCPKYDASFRIQQGSGEPFKDHSKNLLDYTTLLNIYQPCACLSPELQRAPFNKCITDPDYRACVENRCTELYNLGLLKKEGFENQGREALAKIHEHGILPETNKLQPLHTALDVYRSISVTYANQYGRFCVTENLCGYSFGATQPKEEKKETGDITNQTMAREGQKKTGEPVPLSLDKEVRMFSDHNGIPPFYPVNLINNESVGGPMEDTLSVSPTTNKQDLNLNGALRLHELATNPTSGKESDRVHKGIEEVRASGDLRGLPAIIVTGRDDAVVAPNHASRAYFGLNQIVEGGRGNLRYYEITNAHHLDTLNKFYSMAGIFYAPLHFYFTRALNLMYDHLKHGTPLPESQVVRTNPPLTEIPDISTKPKGKNRISFEDMCVKIPD